MSNNAMLPDRTLFRDADSIHYARDARHTYNRLDAFKPREAVQDRCFLEDHTKCVPFRMV